MSAAKLLDLLGKRYLEGFAFGDDPEVSFIPRLKGDDGGGNLVAFILDGTRFVVREDPSDGLRSAASDILVESGGKLRNSFSKVRIDVRKGDTSKWDYPSEEFDEKGEFQGYIEFICPWSGNVIAQIGTSRGDDVYPKFLSYFSPENMAIAASQTQKELLMEKAGMSDQSGFVPFRQDAKSI